ncbi:hypothetical protein H5410_065018 [Solanum commersonii]|uniref:Uncharacterized protein n=1 Tax=Solanum commersonii TaxID=4109 RepID=A0A9J5VYB9_SOLCO|nr:hypothetical protein H5410_065018 [Solanum commersonii]
MGDHSKESLGDHSKSLGDHLMIIHDDPTNVENRLDAKILTPNNKNELQLLLPARGKKCFDFATLRSCTKYLKSIANGIVNVYNHTHHRYCMRHLVENLRRKSSLWRLLLSLLQCAKAYSLEEFDNHFDSNSRTNVPPTAVRPLSMI